MINQFTALLHRFSRCREENKTKALQELETLQAHSNNDYIRTYDLAPLRLQLTKSLERSQAINDNKARERKILKELRERGKR